MVERVAYYLHMCFILFCFSDRNDDGVIAKDDFLIAIDVSWFLLKKR